MRVAKVAITNVCLWAFIWSPYAIVVMIACFGNRSLVTPLVSQLPAFFAKTASCLNPIVFAISHPKYREALTKKLPCLGIREKGDDDSATQMQTVAKTDT
jgi:r-opsin